MLYTFQKIIDNEIIFSTFLSIFKDGPPCKPGVALTDIATGLYCHGSIMASLLHKERTGLGQKIDASLLNTQVSLL